MSNGFDELQPDKLDNGGNNYKLPYIGKAKFRSNDTTPTSVTFRPKAILMVRQNIDEQTL